MGNSKGNNPKAYSLRITNYALQNINEITDYIAYINHEPLRAIKVGDEFFAAIGRIEKNPMIFRECEEIPAKTGIYRKAVCMNWLIIYKIKASEIVVMGICQPQAIKEKANKKDVLKNLGKISY
jgi:plasmid stabilization system protein ParE